MANQRIELPQGTLDLLILKTLALEPLHGWAISERIQQISRDALQVQQGSLYPALHRLERRGWIKARWAVTENNRNAKYYELTGRRPEAARRRGDGLAQTGSGSRLRARYGVKGAQRAERSDIPLQGPLPPREDGGRTERRTAFPPGAAGGQVPAVGDVV